MDSQLASVLTSGSLDAQNGSQCAEGSGPRREVFVEPKEKPSVSTVPGNLQPCPVKAAMTTTRQDAPSVNGKMPEVGGNSKPASQETNKIGESRQPITVKTGVPVLRSQPIRIKIVVPPRCKRPITNSAIRLTKDFACSHFRQPVLPSSGAAVTEKSRSDKSAVEKAAEPREVSCGKTEEPEAQPFQGSEAEGGNKTCSQSDVLNDNIPHADVSQTASLTNTNPVKSPSQRESEEEAKERDADERSPLISKEMNSQMCERFDEEQLEPLDLSLPKKKESHEQRHAWFLDDSGCETSLIMEVDEYEGDGDRDIVEEDDNPEEDRVLRTDGTDALEDSLLSPSFFSTSVFNSLPSLECDTENLLLIDDQGIPYTLSLDGLKVPQVDTSTSDDAPSDRLNPVEAEEEESSQLADLSLSQSLDNALKAPLDICPAQAPDSDSSSLGLDQTKAPEVITSLMLPLSDSSKATEPNTEAGQEANVVLSPPTGMSVPSQPIQILTNPSANAPILLLSPSSSSPQLSSAPVGLSLPLSVTQTAPGASTPMFLLLSSVPSSSGDTASTSTPIAVLDPSTGQFSQITAAPAAVSLPLSSPQVSTLGPPLPMLSHTVIRLSASDPPVVLSGVDTGNPVPPSTPALQNDQHGASSNLHNQISSDLNPGSEAIPSEEVSNENNKPSTFADSSLHPLSANLSHDHLTQPSSEAEAQSPASESKFDPCDLRPEHLPLDDHLYFSNMAAPPSPPTGPILPSGKLDPLSSLDPLSPAASPNAAGPRRVLYCQLCPRVFFYLSDLERHAITHSQKKPHVCQQCGKAFKRSSHLQRHKHIHTGQRNFVCPICTKRFREAGELQRHQRVHTGEKPYQCQLCHTRFAERNTLRRHTKRKHPYHQVAMEMLNERRDRAGGGGSGGISGVQEEEESAEWYSSTVSNLENSESEMET